MKEKVISILNFNFNISNSLFVFEGSPTTTNGAGEEELGIEGRGPEDVRGKGTLWEREDRQEGGA